jgi:hypothetical protein
MICIYGEAKMYVNKDMFTRTYRILTPGRVQDREISDTLG